MTDAMKRRQTIRGTSCFIAGMWFQDLFNYDFRPHRNVHHSLRHPAGRNQLLRLQHRRGWRRSSKNMHKNATGRVYKTQRQTRNLRQGKAVNLANFEHSLVIDAMTAAAFATSNTTCRSPPPKKIALAAKKAYEEQARSAPSTKNWSSEGSTTVVQDRFANRHQASHPGQLRQNQCAQPVQIAPAASGHRKPSRSRRRRLIASKT